MSPKTHATIADLYRVEGKAGLVHGGSYSPLFSVAPKKDTMAHLEVFEGTRAELAVHAEGFAACQDCANAWYWVYQRRDARREEMDW